MADTWSDVSHRFLQDMGDEGYAPAFHTYTEGIYNDRSRPLKERYPAWILRTSWGNSSKFCCQRTRTMQAIPLTQSDAAKAMGIAKQVINRLTQLYVKQGRIHVDQDGRIVLNKKRNENVVVDPPEKKEWAESMRLFQLYFPQRPLRKAEIRAIVEPLQKELRGITTEELRFHRHRVRSGDNWTAPVAGDLFGSGGGADTHQGDNLPPAPVTPAVSPNIGTRPTLNLKQETSLVSEWIERLAAADRAHSLTEIKQTIEQDYGTALQENDPIPGQLLAKAAELTMPTGALCRWIGEFTKKKRAANYEITSPNLYVKAAEKELEPWARRNADLVYRLQYQRDVQARERQSAFEALRNPDAPDDEKQWARKVLGVAAETKGAP